jgi:hypothetical protein
MVPQKFKKYVLNQWVAFFRGKLRLGDFETCPIAGIKRFSILAQKFPPVQVIFNYH